MRISDWSSDVCSSDLKANRPVLEHPLYGGSEVIAFQQVEQPSIVSGLPRLGGGEQCQPPTVSLPDRHGILMIGEEQQVEAVSHLVGVRAHPPDAKHIARDDRLKFVHQLNAAAGHEIGRAHY